MNMQVAAKHLISAWTKATALALLGLGLLAISLTALLPAAAQAATFNIANGDVPELIAAINTANGNGQTNTINLAMGGTYTLTAVDNTPADPNAFPIITSQITINGNGAIIGRSSASGTPSFRFFYITGPNAGDLTLNGVTLTGGDTLIGGGIHNQGNLTVTNSTIANNYGQGAGAIWNENGTAVITSSMISHNESFYYGALWNYGYSAVLTLTNSTVSNNQSDGYRGGGIVNLFGNVTLINSTVSGNKSSNNNPGAGQGVGGIENWPGGSVLTLINSTVSGNTGYQYAGGILNDSGSTLTVVNSTVVGNQDTGGGAGGIYNNGTATLKNTIIANNVTDCGLISPIISLGQNMAGDGSCAFTGTGDLNGTNPLLGPLANNGGPTQTHSPLSGSPAIDAVPVANCTDDKGSPVATDQRGASRPQGVNCDIGSVEVVPTSLGAASGLKSGPLGARVWSFTITNTGPAAASAAQIASFTLAQSGGPACTSPPGVTGASVNGGPNQVFPNVPLGNMAAASSIPVTITIDFSHCTGARFTTTMVLSANGGATTATNPRYNQFP